MQQTSALKVPEGKTQPRRYKTIYALAKYDVPVMNIQGKYGLGLEYGLDEKLFSGLETKKLQDGNSVFSHLKTHFIETVYLKNSRMQVVSRANVGLAARINCDDFEFFNGITLAEAKAYTRKWNKILLKLGAEVDNYGAYQRALLEEEGLVLPVIEDGYLPEDLQKIFLPLSFYVDRKIAEAENILRDPDRREHGIDFYVSEALGEDSDCKIIPIRKREDEDTSELVYHQDGRREVKHNFLEVFFQEIGQAPVLEPSEELAIIDRMIKYREEYRAKIRGNRYCVQNTLGLMQEVLDGEKGPNTVFKKPYVGSLGREALKSRVRTNMATIRGLLQKNDKLYSLKKLGRGKRLVRNKEKISALLGEFQFRNNIYDELENQLMHLIQYYRKLKSIKSKGDYHFRYLEAMEFLSKHNGDLGKMEIELYQIQRLKQEFEKNRNEIVAPYMRLVISIAKKFRGKGVSFRDLIQEGSLGAMDAALDFCQGRGATYVTYATYKIRSRCEKAVKKYQRQIRLPRHIIYSKSQLDSGFKYFYLSRGREPTFEELSEITKLSISQINEIYEAYGTILSINQRDDEHGVDDPLITFLPDKNVLPPPKIAQRNEAVERVGYVVSKLPIIHGKAITLINGLGGNSSHTLEELSGFENLSREAIRQRGLTALDIMHNPVWLAKLRGLV